MPACLNMSNFTTLVGFIGSVITIICFPITIWQIVGMKSSIKASKNALERMEKQKVADLITTILKDVTSVSNSIVSLKADSKKPGFSYKGKKAIEDCKAINLKLNSCLALLPSENQLIKQQLRNAMSHIDQFCTDEPDENIDVAYDSISEAIELLKIEENKSIQENIDLLSKSN